MPSRKSPACVRRDIARVKIAADKDGKLRCVGIDAPGEPAGWAAAERLRCRTSSRSPISASRTSPSPPTRAALAPGARPNHPQAAVITMGAIEDLAAKMNMDPLDLITRNLDITGNRAGIYRDELPIAAEMMEWKQELASARRQDCRAGEARPWPLHAHLGRPRPQQRLRSHHSSRRLGRDQDGHPGPRHRLPHHHHDRRRRHAWHSHGATSSF